MGLEDEAEDLNEILAVGRAGLGDGGFTIEQY